MKRISLDIFRIGKTKDERKTRFEQSNEDRVNMNFKRLQQAIEEVNTEKAESGDTYTKAEADMLLSAKANSADVVPKSGGTFTGDVAFDGVLDITQRRCYATLSSAGWYRVCKIKDIGRGDYSFALDLNICRQFYYANNEQHAIRLVGAWDNFSFVNEDSKSNSQIIKRIRYTRDSNNNGYVDIYYDFSNANIVYCEFAVHGFYPELYTAESLQAVADAPSGETVLTEYTFATITGARVVHAQSSTSFGDAIATIKNIIGDNDITWGVNAANNLHADISNLSSGVVTVFSDGGPAFFVTLGKLNDSYYAAELFTYNYPWRIRIRNVNGTYHAELYYPNY